MPERRTKINFGSSEITELSYSWASSHMMWILCFFYQWKRSQPSWCSPQCSRRKPKTNRLLSVNFFSRFEIYLNQISHECMKMERIHRSHRPHWTCIHFHNSSPNTFERTEAISLSQISSRVWNSSKLSEIKSFSYINLISNSLDFKFQFQGEIVDSFEKTKFWSSKVAVGSWISETQDVGRCSDSVSSR